MTFVFIQNLILPGSSRRKRSSPGNQTSNGLTSSYSIAIGTTGCRRYDENTKEWSTSGCQVINKHDSRKQQYI